MIWGMPPIYPSFCMPSYDFYGGMNSCFDSMCGPCCNPCNNYSSYDPCASLYRGYTCSMLGSGLGAVAGGAVGFALGGFGGGFLGSMLGNVIGSFAGWALGSHSNRHCCYA